mgnify:CR=1 FL=1
MRTPLFLHGDPKYFIRRAFQDKDPTECIEKWGGEILRQSWMHAATDFQRGRNPTKQAQHLRKASVLESLEKIVRESRGSEDGVPKESAPVLVHRVKMKLEKMISLPLNKDLYLRMFLLKI